MRSKSQFFPSEKPISELQTDQQPQLICLKGQIGTLACRVYDPLGVNLFPQRSKPWNRLKYAWLSAEKMHNLIAVRGRPGASMVGPADYFCDLERSDQYLYTIDIGPERLPVFKQYPLNHLNSSETIPLKTIVDHHTTKVAAKWYSGFNKEEIDSKKAEYKESSVFGANLFPNSGILEIDGPKEIKLHAFDPTGIDLSGFKARLVPNDVPFQITAHRLYVDDEYCAISYQFDAGYADEQVNNGGGIFLEFHQFAQTITPLEPNASGFVTLAKWNERHTQLELIAIQIPYGSTLIIEKNCIHGDTTLNGLFLMCMTSDHISMATADTVFLKHTASKDNIRLQLDNIAGNQNDLKSQRKLDPLVFFEENKDADFAKFKARTKNMDFIFAPTPGYWEVQKDTIGTIALLVVGGACFIAAILLSQTIIPCFILLGVAGFLVSAALFKTLQHCEMPVVAGDNLLPQAFAV